VLIPDELEWEQAVTGDPFSVSFHGVLIRPPRDGETVLVYGCGTLGLLAIHVVKALWPRTRVLAAYRYEHQKELALRFGAEIAIPARPVGGLLEAVAQATDARLYKPWFGHGMLMGGVDVIYDTVSDPETVEISIRVAAEHGTVVLIGMEASKRFEWSPIMFKELTVTGSMAFGMETFEGRRAHAMEHYLELVRAGRIDARPILTHRFALDDWRTAFATLLDKGRTRAVKAVFTF
jgi:threonine dehydrogenase-like Zn-dependent dehydrogenase